VGTLVKKPEPLHTVAETAKILNVSEKTVRRLIADGWLRVIRTDALLTQDHINLVRMHPASRQGLREPGRNPGRLRCPPPIQLALRRLARA